MANTPKEWTRRPIFTVLCERWLEVWLAKHPGRRKMEANEALAKALKLPDYNNLRQYMGNGIQVPSPKRLAQFAAGLGCDIDEIKDLEIPSPPGVSEKIWDFLPEAEKVRANVILRNFVMLPADQRELFAANIELARQKYLERTAKAPPLPGNTTGEKCRLAREYYDHTIPQVVFSLKQRGPLYPISEERLERIEADLEKPEAALLEHLGDIYGVPGYKLEATPTAPKPKADEKAKHRSAR